MLRLHVQFTCHLVAVVCKKIVVQRFLVARNGAAYARGMCRKDGAYLWQLVVDVECTETAHPFIGMVDDPLAGIQKMTVEALNDQCGGV